MSMRETMQKHRQEMRCAGCHSRMDPLGLALEEFDAIGRNRQVVVGDSQLDPELDMLPDGTTIKDLEGLKEYLLQGQPRRYFIKNFSENLLTYAMTRELQSGDFYTLLSMRRALEQQDHRFSAAVTAVVSSDIFLQRSEE